MNMETVVQHQAATERGQEKDIVHEDMDMMMSVQATEDNFEEMTLEIDLNTIKGSPLDHDSLPSNAADDDSQQSFVDQQRGTAVKQEDGNPRSLSIMAASPVEYRCDGDDRIIQKTKQGKTTFTCEVCSKIFEKRSRLVSHMLTHSDEKDHICHVCNKGFKNKSQLQRHSNTHSDIPRFCCNICGRGFKHNDVAKHIRRFHSGPRKSSRGGVANPGAEINSQYSSQQEIVESHHLPQQFEENQPPLQEVPQLQSNQERILSESSEEMEQKFGGLQEHQLDQTQSLDLGVCHIDSFSGSSSSDSVKIASNTMTLFPCNQCNKSFSKRSGLASHMMIHQSLEGEVMHDPNKVKNQCHLCSKTFTRASGLTAHLELHTRTEKRREPNPDFRCSLCGKIFTRRSGLNAHVLQHGGVLRFWCDEPDCGKGFVHSYQMTRHKRSHSEVSPYTCHICGKSFRHNDLSKHMRIHTGAKPYNCQHCGKAFAFSSSLRTHERMHLALREHFCEICNMGFTTSAGLRRHAKCHEEEREEICSFCGKQFPSKIHLSLHLQESQHCAQQHQQQQQHESSQIQQIHDHEVHHIQVQPLVEPHLQQQVHVLHIPVEDVPGDVLSQQSHPISLHVTHGSDNSTHDDNGATLAALTAPNPEHVQIQLPVGSDQATVSSPANVGSLPILVPFSVSVPTSVPFGVNLNSSTADQVQLNHFLSWEQKF